MGGCVAALNPHVAHGLDLLLRRQPWKPARYVAHPVPLLAELLAQFKPHLLHGAAAQGWYGQEGTLEDGNAQKIYLAEEHRNACHTDPPRIYRLYNWLVSPTWSQ